MAEQLTETDHVTDAELDDILEKAGAVSDLDVKNFVQTSTITDIHGTERPEQAPAVRAYLDAVAPIVATRLVMDLQDLRRRLRAVVTPPPGAGWFPLSDDELATYEDSARRAQMPTQHAIAAELILARAELRQSVHVAFTASEELPGSFKHLVGGRRVSQRDPNVACAHCGCPMCAIEYNNAEP